MYIKLLGIFAGFCTTIAFLPQVIKVYKTKSTKDISLTMFVVFNIGVCCWLFYGVMIEDIPIIIANISTLILSGLILIGKLKYK